MNTLEIGNRYVALCKDGKFDQCLNELFAENAVSVEAGAPPGMDRITKGLPAIRAKGEWWGNNHTIHSIELSGPYPNDDRFAVRFVFDITQKQSGRRVQMDEVGLYTVEGGKITREEFFYTMG